MARIVVAVVRNGAMEGTFASITDVDPAWDVEAFVARIKVWSTSLADIESRHMTVFGPWADQPRVAEVPLRMREEPCRAADLLGTLVGGMESAFFLVRITTPPVAAGESVALAWHAWSVPTILVV
jgi:hypothetical protein